MNQTIKVSIGIAIALLMTACGSNGESEKGIISSGDTGECMKIPVYYTIKKILSKERDVSDGAEDFFTTEITESNKKGFKVYLESHSESTAMPTRTEYKTTINIKNNYIHVIKREIEMKTLDGEVILKSTETHDSNYARLPSGKVCKGQSWDNSYKTITKITIPEKKKHEHTTNGTDTIEDINILKTIEAGEFSTYIRVREWTTEGKPRKSKSWVDAETGVSVYGELYMDNKLFSTHELIELTR